MVAQRSSRTTYSDTLGAVARADVTHWEGNLHEGVDGLDLVRTYLQEAQACPRTTAAQERELAAIIRDTHRPRAERESAVQTLVVGQLYWVARLARRFQRFRVPMADLISSGNEGLLHAAWKFDGSRRFSTYSTYWTLVYMQRLCCAQAVGTSFPWYLWMTYLKARAVLLQHPQLSAEAVAARLDAKPEHVTALWPWLQGIYSLSLLVHPSDMDDSAEIADFVAGPVESDPSLVVGESRETRTTPILRYLLDPHHNGRIYPPLTWMERRNLAIRYHVRVPIAWLLPTATERRRVPPADVEKAKLIARQWLASLQEVEHDGEEVPTQVVTYDEAGRLQDFTRSRSQQLEITALEKLRTLARRLGVKAEEVL